MTKDGEWNVAGEPRFEMIVKGADLPRQCHILVAPDACEECPLSSFNRKERPSPWLQWLLQLHSLVAAGAQFHYTELSPREWHGLIILKAELNKREIDRIRKGVD